jgi:hypothetical protein
MFVADGEKAVPFENITSKVCPVNISVFYTHVKICPNKINFGTCIKD